MNQVKKILCTGNNRSTEEAGIRDPVENAVHLIM
jgi:hypothetical protein